MDPLHSLCIRDGKKMSDGLEVSVLVSMKKMRIVLTNLWQLLVETHNTARTI
jgi:hypothetical protein